MVNGNLVSEPTQDIADLPSEPTLDLAVKIVHRFYATVRADAVLGPIFEAKLAGRWDMHLSKMVDFWTSVTMQTGAYSGRPHAAHAGLGLTAEHFTRWLALFAQTVDSCCTGYASALFYDRAQRIADSLQIGLNIGPKALVLPIANSNQRAG